MDLSGFGGFWASLAATRLAPWRRLLESAVTARIAAGSHGDLPRWEAALRALPELPAGRPMLDRAAVGVDAPAALSPEQTHGLREALMALHPWRKGPFDLHGVYVDAEWRSDWKWDRLAPALSDPEGRLVLDVGCGNGYHAWRLRGAGARLVLGIDPTWLYAVQFQAVRRYVPDDGLSVLPLALEDLPAVSGAGLPGFDTVLSMGVLYHRRSPMDHLAALHALLRPGGELVLETLVLPGAGERLLVPPGRYAAMRNCWFIPTAGALAVWLARCGFRHARVVDVTPTSTEEQRATPWMRFQSLADHLDPADPSRTVEGHPAPTRALLIAERGGR